MPSFGPLERRSPEAERVRAGPGPQALSSSARHRQLGPRRERAGAIEGGRGLVSLDRPIEHLGGGLVVGVRVTEEGRVPDGLRELRHLPLGLAVRPLGLVTVDVDHHVPGGIEHHEAGLPLPGPRDPRETGRRYAAVSRAQAVGERPVVAPHLRDEDEVGAECVLRAIHPQARKVQLDLAPAHRRVQVRLPLLVGHLEAEGLVEIQRLVERCTGKQGNDRFGRLARRHVALLRRCSSFATCADTTDAQPARAP